MWFNLPLVDWVSMISNAVVAIAAVSAAVIGFLGVRQWQQEMKGKARYDLVRRIVVLAYSFNEQFDGARNPVTWASELSARPRTDGEDRDEAFRLDEYHARLARLEPLRNTLVQLREAGWEAKILLSPGIDAYVNQLTDSYTELSIAIRSYFDLSLSQSRDKERYLTHEMRTELTHKIYGIPGDEYGKKVKDTVGELVDCLRKATA